MNTNFKALISIAAVTAALLTGTPANAAAPQPAPYTASPNTVIQHQQDLAKLDAFVKHYHQYNLALVLKKNHTYSLYAFTSGKNAKVIAGTPSGTITTTDLKNSVHKYNAKAKAVADAQHMGSAAAILGGVMVGVFTIVGFIVGAPGEAIGG
jgi:hypothetical protein